MGDDSEWLKLPTDEKCQHKLWKARQAGYEEAIKFFQTLGDEKSPEFSKYLGLVKKFVVDNNAIAQEKGLEACLAFVENATVAGKTAGEVCNGVVAKCLNQRTKTKDLGVAILMTYIEAEKQEIVQEELLKGLTNKQPKIVSVCVSTLREALRDFGTKIISIKPILKQLQPLLEDRDKTVRDETKLLVVEIYRWIGPALKPQLTNLKPVQVTELEAEFEKLPSSKPQQTRFLRSQQDLKAKMLEKATAGDDAECSAETVTDGQSAAADVDPYEMIDPVDILSKLPKDFYEKVEEKKWQDRREALEAVQKLADTPKLEQGDYNDLLRALRKVVAKDSNIMLVTVAAKCIALIATGLRKKFAPHSVACVEVLFEKFREKKASVVQTLKEAVDACYVSTNLEAISEVCIAALEHKTPSVKAETASFLARCFSQCTPVTLPKKVLKLYIAPLLKAVNDSAGEVREAAFDALGTAMKVITEKALLPFLPDIDNLKMAKIKECCEKAVVVGKAGASSKAPPAEGNPAASAKAAPPKTAVLPAKKDTTTAKPSAKKSSDSGSSSVASTSSQLASSAGGKKKATNAGKGKKGGSAAKEEIVEKEICDEAVSEKIAELFPDGLTGLDNANWKERVSAVEKMTEVVKGMERDAIPTQVFIRTITKKPGLKENNFQVMKLKVDLITFLALNSRFTKTSADVCLPDLIEKISDTKNGTYIQEALSSIAEATSLDFVAHQVVQSAFEQKNPKNQSEALNWLATAIKQFGFKVSVKPLVDTIGKALAATNPGVRTSAVTLLGVIYLYMGSTLRVWFENEKPALLQQIDGEFEKVKGEKPPQPTRGVKPMDEVTEETEEGEEGGGGDSVGINIADLVPRTDISERLTESLITEMADKSWKVRKEGLDKVQAILNEAKFITTNIGPLPEALKLRLADSNKILVTATLAICQSLATAIGPNIKQHVRVIGPGLISNLGDSKANIRQQAVSTLNVWLEQTGIQVFVEAEMFSDALKLENPNLRAELLGWLAEKLPTCKKLPAEFQECIPYLFACLEDRNADVRKKAQEALLPFMIHAGYDSMVRHAGKLKPASKDPVMKALETARASLPQKPVKTASQPAVVKGGGGVKAKEPPKMDYDEDELDDASSRATSAASNKTNITGGKAKAKPNGAGGSSAATVPNKKGSAVANTVAGATGKKKNQDEEDSSPPLKVSNGKDQRFKDEKNLKVFKWNFPTPRPEIIEQLKVQMEPTFNRTLVDQLFHVDFKFHIKAMDTLIKACEMSPEATISNLDLLLKWLTLRFFDTNTTVLMKALEYLQFIFNTLIAEDYHLQELEAVSFIPYLVNKVGDPKDIIRRDVHSILQLICKVYTPAKLFSYLLEGLKSKNAKQRTECLEDMSFLIISYGINVCQPTTAQALQAIAKQISDRDNSVRSAALNAIVAAHSILGDNVFKHIGLLNEKDQSMLDERIKRAAAKPRPQGPPGGGVAVSAPNCRMSPEEKPKVTKTMASGPVKQSTAELRNTAPRPSRSKGQFQLEFDEIDTSENYEMPELIEPDLNEILDAPVKLPVTRMRPPSPAIKLLHSSADAKSAVNLVISQIASNEMTTILQALQQIDEVLKDSEKSEALHGHVDQLLNACAFQLRCAYNRNISENEMNREVIRLYRCLLATLISLCKCRSLVQEATRDVLKDLISNLITILLDNRLNDLEDGPDVIRAVNVTVVKFVEFADATNIMSALLKLLHETVGNETCSPQFLELVMKCLWKMVRMLPSIINDLNLDRVICDTNQFLKAFPSFTWKAKSTDMPLRTVKTILHSLARLKGQRILNHLTLIDCNDHSEVESYLRKVLRTSSDTEAVATTNIRNEQLNGNTENASGISTSTEGSDSGRNPRQISRTVHDTLADIFKKIGSKENTREGLNNLYDFKLKHPDADLDPFLKKSSQFFQDYIERGLRSIAQEREGRHKATTVYQSEPAVQISNTSENRLPSTTDVSPAEYMERLKVLRAKCGFENSQLSQEGKNCTDSTSSTESVNSRVEPTRVLSSNVASNPSSRPLSAASATQDNTTSLSADTTASTHLNLEELKKRLDKIKTARKD